MEPREAIERALSDLPLMLTVGQTCAVLGIGRSLGYAQVRRYLATGGREGIPAVRIGSVLRIPRTALVELIAAVTIPSGDDALVLRSVVDPSSSASSSPRSGRARRRASNGTSATVAQLPFAVPD
jgi:hypothetical protein